ncbi:cell division protein FtsA [Peribacillus cavernae]|uniref:Cell division protein FtsA n=1 Tax=Peribacillus cavernae TaxID=1674310 RepID=A0A433HHF3_9BACI|nr:cell division protein FtsA [Peribacillus cavernae]MDQ0221106.1 cell division protein FtsA [Peribacillus cavernae]RUQ27602.1 cell division protein FtsA [Peribacillus cavernae]
MQEKIFALDIGTRSVVGIILEKQDENYIVKDILEKEHTERAMLDGQIHDVIAVSKIIQEIKTDLEKKHGILESVCVAAAGRALKTERAEITTDIKGKPMMQREDIIHLELSAVQQAQALVAEKGSAHASYHYYCVGYSVLYYRLDGQEIGNLIDQSGDEASVEIIATFLPKVVVESLIAALKRADLEMQALTLEPIAAINVLIPRSMRRLNVALVDIGAGTSDIALTDSGTVIAYGMVPVAGDEITEAISDQLLLDFPLAEQAKRQLAQHEEITVTDILGFETSIPKQEVISQLSPALEKLADAICSEILLLNSNKSPKAVMLVGGGSLTPELPFLLAGRLGLPANRVAIRGLEAIQNLTLADELKKGPELVTPIGIAIAAHKNPIQYMSVTVNGQAVRLFDMKRMTVGDCLLTAGIKLNRLYGKPGIAMMVSLNGHIITIPGLHGKKPLLLLNGLEATLDDEVDNGDEITVKKGEDGSPPIARIHDLIDHAPKKTITINGAKHTIEAQIIRNGLMASREDFVEDRDEIICNLPQSIKEVLAYLTLEHLVANIQPFFIKINEKNRQVTIFSGKIERNGITVKPGSPYEDGDEINVIQPSIPNVATLANAMNAQVNYSIPVTFNGKRILLSKRLIEFYRNDELLDENTLIRNGDILKCVQHKRQPFIFQDIFKFVEIDMPLASNGRFVLMNNNKETSFDQPVASGDVLKIIWTTMPQKRS